MGGSDVVHYVQFSLTGTACSCLMAYGTKRDYVAISYSLCCTLSWCFGGLSCCIVQWAHPNNVANVKSGESGAYYVIHFVLGTVVSLPDLGYVSPFIGDTTFGFGVGCLA